MCLSFRPLQSHLLSHWFPTIKWTFTKQLLKDTWQAKCFQWSSRWTGWRERPPYQRTAPSSGQKGDNKEKKFQKQATRCIDLFCFLQRVCVLPTIAGIDHGPNIPPFPVTGSKIGMIESRKAEDRGAWWGKILL